MFQTVLVNKAACEGEINRIIKESGVKRKSLNMVMVKMAVKTQNY